MLVDTVYIQNYVDCFPLQYSLFIRSVLILHDPDTLLLPLVGMRTVCWDGRDTANVDYHGAKPDSGCMLSSFLLHLKFDEQS